ncbi:MAG: AmmeMemoRadiSam system protein B [Vicinamibacteria bacterium]
MGGYPSDSVRKAAVAGSWYPGRASDLRAEVEAYLSLSDAPPRLGPLVGLISPHAGLRYSGPVAAHGYALLRGCPELTVVLVGPSHRLAFDGVAVWARGSFETPLGPIPIDEPLATRILAAAGGLKDDPRPHRDEHSLEMQLPFLQHLVGHLRIVPMLMGRQTREDVDHLAETLGRVLPGRKDVLLVASSDLSHYQSAPVAHRLDAFVVGDVERFDAEGLMGRLESHSGHACGGGPMVAVMKASRFLGATAAVALRYADSGDVGEKDKTRVVGYLSAALCGPAS